MGKKQVTQEDVTQASVAAEVLRLYVEGLPTTTGRRIIPREALTAHEDLIAYVHALEDIVGAKHRIPPKPPYAHMVIINPQGAGVM